jgi:diguanylate cyclase (GGDEF)-like protein
MKHFTLPVAPTSDSSAAGWGLSPYLPFCGVSELVIDPSAGVRLERLNASAQCILVVDLEGRAMWLNTAAQQVCDAGDFPADLGEDWLDYWPIDERPTIALALESARLGIPARFTAACRKTARHEAYWDVNVTPDGPRIAGRPSFTAYLHDVTDRRLALQKLQWTAMHDGLTGLANRTLFYDSLDRTIEHARKSRGEFVLLVFDLDQFKQINERLGHDGGDALLRDFARRLAGLVPDGGLAARFGGDEFALLMRAEGSRDEILASADEILAHLRFPFTYGGRSVECTASAGVAVYPHGGTTSDEIFQNADIALLTGKAQEPGRAVMFSGEMRQDLQRRASSLELAAAALQGDWIEPHYQPKIDLVSGQLCGLEALLRWKQPGGAWQSPFTISAAFNDRRVATKITDMMLRKVIVDLGRWLRFGCAVPVAMNASSADLERDDFAEFLLARLDEGGIPASLIELEVTEGVFLGQGAAHVGRVLRTLSDAGVRIALDDFGTGYASLSHLKQYPVHVIKIDRSFVSSLTTSHEDRVIVKTMIELGKSMSIEVVAEGIEDEEQLSFIKSAGCDVGQGYLFGKAMPATEVEESYWAVPKPSVFTTLPDPGIRRPS